MTCGCAPGTVPLPPGAREAAALCHLCLYAEHAPVSAAVKGMVACTLDGAPMLAAVTRPCPAGLHPDRDGVVRWMGVRWEGVPAPIRWWLWAFHPRHPRPGSFAGCGCVRVLKRAWRRLRGAKHG